MTAVPDAPPLFDDPGLTPGASRALNAAVHGLHAGADPSWTRDRLEQLALRLLHAPSRIHDIDATLAADAEQVLSALDALAGWNPTRFATSALAAGLTTGDLHWLAQYRLPLDDEARVDNALPAIGQITDTAARRLVLVLVVRARASRVDVDMTTAFAEALTGGHDEIARLACDGMSVREAAAAVRVQDRLDQAARTSP